jgi:hypothetical protein
VVVAELVVVVLVVKVAVIVLGDILKVVVERMEQL